MSRSSIGTLSSRSTTLARMVKRVLHVVGVGGVVPAEREILVPGERGDRTSERRNRDGIQIARATFDELERVAHRFSVTMP